MNRVILVTAILSAALVTALVARVTAQDRKTTKDMSTRIESLWKDFDKARSSDRPKTQLEILDKIRDLSLSSRSSWDYYKACTSSYNTSVRMNWRLRDSVSRVLRVQVADYDDPIMVVRYMLDYNEGLPFGSGSSVGYQDRSAVVLDYIRSNRSRLKASLSPSFITEGSYSTKVRTVLKEGSLFSDDYQNALALSLLSRYDEKTADCLLEDVGESYPQKPWTEFIKVSHKNYSPLWGQERDSKRIADLEAFVGRYASTAMAVHAREEILKVRMDRLSEDKGSSSDYRALYDDAVALSKDASSFKGAEAVIARDCGIRSIVSTLEQKQVRASVKDRSLTVYLRNVPSVSVVMKGSSDRKTVWKTRLDNARHSFYVEDTLTVPVPEVSDGEYVLSFDYGKKEYSIRYQQYTISLATRLLGSRHQIYAAHYLTGEPLPEVSGIPLDGFTDLPSDIVSRLESDRKQTFRARVENPDGTVWLSREIAASSFDRMYEPSPSVEYEGFVLTDCAAFHPGDTVKFKVIGYEYHSGEKDTDFRRTVPEGTALNVRLLNAESDMVGSLSLQANSFGSASGEFVLPKEGRGGYYTLELYGRDYMGSARVYVGDYVLPTFEILLDPQKEYLFKGDAVRFTGRVHTFSDRNIEPSSATYTLRTGGSKGVSQDDLPLEVRPDGSFSIDVSGAEEHAMITVKITDSTGETKTASSSVWFSERPDVYASVENTVPDADVSLDGYLFRRFASLVGSDTLKVRFSSSYPVDRITYRLVSSSGRTVLEGQAHEGQNTILLPSVGAGLYSLESECSVRGIASLVQKTDILLVREGATRLEDKVSHLIIPRDGLSVQIGSSESDVWAVVSLFDYRGGLIESRLEHIVGRLGAEGSIRTVTFDRKGTWHGPFTIGVFWFRNSSAVEWSHQADIMDTPSPLPLSFSSFTDRTSPSVRTTFTLQTGGDVEAAVTVYDRSSEVMSALRWQQTYPIVPYVRVPSVSRFAGMSASPANSRLTRSVATMSLNRVVDEEVADLFDGPMLSFDAAVESAVSSKAVAYEAPMRSMWEEAAVVDTDTPVQVRESLLDVIAFDPHLYPDSEGRISYTFTPSGKLSTYIVRAYVHDRDMNTASVSREVVVYLPVQVSVQPPQFLYEGDRYVLHVAVSASSDTKVSGGTMTLAAYDSSDDKGREVFRQSRHADLSDGSAQCDFDLGKIPSSESGNLAFKVTFSATAEDGSNVSDGVLVSCPVYPASKVMTESHSGVLTPSMDRKALVDMLKGQFTNLSSDRAVESERTIMQMASEVLDPSREASYDDAVSLMQALYVRALSSKILDQETSTSDLVSKLLALRTSDGGFSWRDGMDGSEYVTSYILSACSDLKAKGVLPAELSDLSAAVKFLDRSFLTREGRWSGTGVDLYCQIRSQYADVPLDVKVSSEKSKAISEFLTQKDGRLHEGDIMLKVRRVLTTDALTDSDEGIALAKAWGVRLATSSRLDSSRRKDIASLTEYAQRHPMGGTFFPNAVMPFRGLLESELQAHVLLARLFRYENPELADSIRLWIMLQKETQKWESDPSCVMAISAVMDGSMSLLGTKVVSLTASAEQPFGKVRAAGDGMGVKTVYMIQDRDRGWTELRSGTVLKVGQKVRAEYTLTSEQNRSFVMFEAPRPACLLADNQKSSRVWFNMYGLYRDVRRTSTQYWFDVFPEDKYTLTEDFTVVQEGVFQSPAPEIQCMYAPHWRANGGAAAPTAAEF